MFAVPLVCLWNGQTAGRSLNVVEIVPRWNVRSPNVAVWSFWSSKYASRLADGCVLPESARPERIRASRLSLTLPVPASAFVKVRQFVTFADVHTPDGFEVTAGEIA